MKRDDIMFFYMFAIMVLFENKKKLKNQNKIQPNPYQINSKRQKYFSVHFSKSKDVS